MSLKPETFYAIRCDFPGCGDLYEGGEYTYNSDPYYNADLAEDDGWLIAHLSEVLSDLTGGHDYCPDHCVVVDCDIDDCEGCKVGDHLAPLEDTVENRLKVSVGRCLENANRKLDILDSRTRQKLSPRSDLASRTKRALDGTFEAACRNFKPEISAQELADLMRKEAVHQ